MPKQLGEVAVDLICLRLQVAPLDDDPVPRSLPAIAERWSSLAARIGGTIGSPANLAQPGSTTSELTSRWGKLIARVVSRRGGAWWSACF
jgi:hypothetical protein